MTSKSDSKDYKRGKGRYFRRLLSIIFTMVPFKNPWTVVTLILRQGVHQVMFAFLIYMSHYLSVKVSVY